jgi:outer membrane protein assembly factor BamB
MTYLLNTRNNWNCVELKTGKVIWTGRGAGKGAVIYANGMLYAVGHNGRVALLAANPLEYKMISLFALPRGKGQCWAHPVISDIKLYLRWNENLYVYNIRE